MNLGTHIRTDGYTSVLDEIMLECEGNFSRVFLKACYIVCMTGGIVG